MVTSGLWILGGLVMALILARAAIKNRQARRMRRRMERHTGEVRDICRAPPEIDDLRSDRGTEVHTELARPESRKEPVEFNVFAPRQIRPGDQFVLDIWAHQASDYERVRERAVELAREFNAGRKAAVPIARGSRLTVTVRIPGLKLVRARDEIDWDGEPANASFAVKVPDDSKCRSHAGTAVVSCLGLTIAQITFSIVVSPTPDSALTDRSNGTFRPRISSISSGPGTRRTPRGSRWSGNWH